MSAGAFCMIKLIRTVGIVGIGIVRAVAVISRFRIYVAVYAFASAFAVAVFSVCVSAFIVCVLAVIAEFAVVTFSVIFILVSRLRRRFSPAVDYYDDYYDD